VQLAFRPLCVSRRHTILSVRTVIACQGYGKELTGGHSALWRIRTLPTVRQGCHTPRQRRRRGSPDSAEKRRNGFLGTALA
jgi:hypothetical protein